MSTVAIGRGGGLFGSVLFMGLGGGLHEKQSSLCATDRSFGHYVKREQIVSNLSFGTLWSCDFFVKHLFVDL